MCSTLKYKSCVGRNFDYEISYKEQVMQIPKNQYYNMYDIIGVVTGVTEDFPLMYDGMNEKGLVCCGLAFEGNAYYKSTNEISEDKFTVTIKPYEFVFGILSSCETVEDVKGLLKNGVIIDENYSEELKNSDLHWFVSDGEESIIVEQTKDGLNWYNGTVMTNNPPYPLQKELWDNFKKLIGNISFKNLFKRSSYDTRGLETYDLNGDYTSFGRFQRLTWLSNNLQKNKNSFDDVSQTFHLLSSVEQIYGSTPVDDKFEYTIYSNVYDMKNKKMYIKTYDNWIVSMFDFNFSEGERFDI